MLSVRSLFALSLVLLLLTSGKSTASFPLSDGMSASGVYSNAARGFSYTPPSGLRDLTAAMYEAEGRQARSSKTHSSLLLLMASGPDDTAPDWLSLGIETYQRGRNREKGDDITAGFITNL